MAYISYNKIWESEFDNSVSKKVKVQDMNINHLKFEIHDTYEKDEKTTAKYESTDVINKAFLDENLSKIDGH